MHKSDPKTLVSTNWLAEKLGDPNLRILDASWYLPAMKRDPIADFRDAHIPGAVFFDIDAIADQSTDLPHMMPSAEMFCSRVQAMGIGDGNQIVVYDGSGLMSAARVWWLFRAMGIDQIAVLDGGFPKWRSEGRPIADTVATKTSRHFTPHRNVDMVRDRAAVAAAEQSGDTEIIDARPPGRFRGEDPEPRAGLRSGHIPNSRNVFFKDLLNQNGTLKSSDDMRAIFKAAGVDLSKPAITTCGSGVTAAVLNLALEIIGHDKNSLYDGSWADWGLPGDTRVATGDA
jgi:thiosulfate/3-mercaptopyruvate sulfurtransferase